MRRPHNGRAMLPTWFALAALALLAGCSGMPATQQASYGAQGYGSLDSDAPGEDSGGRVPGGLDPVATDGAGTWSHYPSAPGARDNSPAPSRPRGASSDHGSRFASVTSPVGGLVVETPPLRRAGG